jgi:hypothetical protein
LRSRGAENGSILLRDPGGSANGVQYWISRLRER